MAGTSPAITVAAGPCRASSRRKHVVGRLLGNTLARATGGRVLIPADNDVFRQAVADSGYLLLARFHRPPGKRMTGAHGDG